MMGGVFQARGIAVDYSRLSIIKSVDFDVQPGSVIGLIGHNGAGKSTLLSALAGVTPVRCGSVSIDGRELTRAQWQTISRHGVSYVPQGRGVFVALTVRENLALGLRAGAGVKLDGAEGRTRLAEVLAAVPPLEALLDKRAGQLSGGQQGLVSIGRGLIVRPFLLLLDEPSTGLAPIMVKEVLAIIQRLKQGGRTSVVLVEQNVPQVLGAADYLYVLKAGSFAAQGPAECFRDSRVLMELF